jgi:hypothetical protein
LIKVAPQDFVSKWRRVTAREKQTYQEHFLDLCQLVGHPTPNEYDPTGTRFGFERDTPKTIGGRDWADIAKLRFFGWDYKGKNAAPDKAYDRLLRYRDALPKAAGPGDLRHQQHRHPDELRRSPRAMGQIPIGHCVSFSVLICLEIKRVYSLELLYRL